MDAKLEQLFYAALGGALSVKEKMEQSSEDVRSSYSACTSIQCLLGIFRYLCGNDFMLYLYIRINFIEVLDKPCSLH